MNTDYLQTLRYKLQRRVRRLNSMGFQLFHSGLQQLWGFLQNEPLLKGILEILEVESIQVAAEADQLLSAHQAIACATEKENILCCYLVLKHCAESENPRIEESLGHLYTHETMFDSMVERFRDVFVEPFYDYLDEALDERALMLSLLRRYKQRCEWFHRDRLFRLWTEDTQRGEKKLALDLYEYLFDQGIDFHIEPKSASGEADLVSSQTGEQRLVADAKIFDPGRNKGKSYVIRGFNQIYTYTRDYNEPFGFLVIFKTCEDSLHFTLPEKASAAPFLSHNNKTIFFVVVDLYPYENTASQRGPLRSVEISASELVSSIAEGVAEKSADTGGAAVAR